MPSAGRIHSLDGVRGVAALVVMLYHVSLVTRPHLTEETWAWLTQSPLKLLTVGTESVLVFFVLSGLVVALPTLKNTFSWATYYPHRVLRLYAPVFGSLVLAAALILLVPRNPAAVPDGSWMADAQATSVSVESFFSEASLFRVTYDINNVLWSLRWELIFSLLLPIFVYLGMALRKHALFVAVGCAALSVIGRVSDVDALIYLPIFMIGTLIAVRLDDIVEWGQRQRSRSLWAALGALGAFLMVASWIMRPVFASGTPGNLILWGFSGGGAALIIVLAVASPGARRFLERGPVQWLGKISFSLYLVHAPIIGTLGFVLGDRWWWATGLIGIPVSILVAAVFFSAVEAPTQRMSRAVGRWGGRTLGRARALTAR